MGRKLSNKGIECYWQRKLKANDVGNHQLLPFVAENSKDSMSVSNLLHRADHSENKTILLIFTILEFCEEINKAKQFSKVIFKQCFIVLETLT